MRLCIVAWRFKVCEGEAREFQKADDVGDGSELTYARVCVCVREIGGMISDSVFRRLPLI